MARAHGADAALLITAVLSDQDLCYFIKVLKSLNMAALVEVHSEEEMDRVLALGDQVLSKDHVLIGINNRDLQSFKVIWRCRLFVFSNAIVRMLCTLRASVSKGK